MNKPIEQHEGKGEVATAGGTRHEAATYILDTDGSESAGGSSRARAALPTGFELVNQSYDVADLVHYDTFDWRLLSAGCEVKRRGSTWQLRDLDTDREEVVLLPEPVTARAPCSSVRAEFFPSDNQGLVSQRVSAATGNRRAIALMWERETVHRYRIEDPVGKTHALLERFEWVDSSPAGRRGRGKDAPTVSSAEPIIVWGVRPLRGYAATARRVIDSLVEHGDRISWLQALAARFERSDPAPAYHRERADGDLNAHERAGMAVSRIGLHFLQVMEEQVPGILLRIDPEYLHDFRVTLRRLRTLVSALKKVFSEEQGGIVRRTLRDIWELTGTARDLDVLNESWDRYRLMIAASLRGDLEPLIEYTDHTREEAYRALHEYICSGGLDRDVRDLRSRFQSLEDGAVASKAIRLEAGKALAKHVNRIRAEIGRLDESDEKTLHQLRVQCKKLRYLIEVFGELFAGKQLRRFTKDLKGVQSILGDLNDLTVQQEALNAFLREMPNTSSRSAAAVGAVITKLEEEKNVQRRVVRTKLGKHVRHLDNSAWLALFRSAAG